MTYFFLTIFDYQKAEAKLSEIIEFRQTYMLMQTRYDLRGSNVKTLRVKLTNSMHADYVVFWYRYPFSIFFGLAHTRESCIESASKVFQRLLRRQEVLGGEVECSCLDFSLLYDVAKKYDGSTDKTKLKRLIRLLRPSRSGQLTSLDFLKVCIDIDCYPFKVKSYSASEANLVLIKMSSLTEH
jgi:hypothetical protein